MALLSADAGAIVVVGKEHSGVTGEQPLLELWAPEPVDETNVGRPVLKTRPSSRVLNRPSRNAFHGRAILSEDPKLETTGHEHGHDFSQVSLRAAVDGGAMICDQQLHLALRPSSIRSSATRST